MKKKKLEEQVVTLEREVKWLQTQLGWHQDVMVGIAKVLHDKLPKPVTTTNAKPVVTGPLFVDFDYDPT